MNETVKIVRPKKRSATRYEQFMDNFEEWVGYWRANPHRFITDYLQLKLYDFQQVLIYMMFFYPNFVFVASRGLKVVFRSEKIYMSKYEFNERYFKNIDQENKAYWLGFLYADGCILEMKLYDGTKIPQTIQISISIKDIDILHKFMKDIELDKKIYIGTAYNKKSETQYCRLQIGSGLMCADLNKYGCYPRKTHSLKFPNNIPDNLIRHFIRGYFDGDGSVYFTERMQYDKRRDKEYLQQKFCCNFQGTYEFLFCLSNILNKENIKTSPIRTGHGKVYSLDFGRRESIINFFHYLYDDAHIFLDRKYKKFIDTFKYLQMVA